MIRGVLFDLMGTLLIEDRCIGYTYARARDTPGELQQGG